MLLHDWSCGFRKSCTSAPSFVFVAGFLEIIKFQRIPGTLQSIPDFEDGMQSIASVVVFATNFFAHVWLLWHLSVLLHFTSWGMNSFLVRWSVHVRKAVAGNERFCFSRMLSWVKHGTGCVVLWSIRMCSWRMRAALRKHVKSYVAL